MISVKKKLLLYFPATGPGGVQSIILRFAEAAYRLKVPISIIDHPRGYISEKISLNYLIGRYVNLVISDSLDKLSLSDDHTFICFNHQLPVAGKLYFLYGINFVFWDVHSITIQDMLSIKLFNRKILSISPKRFLKQIQQDFKIITIDAVSAENLKTITGVNDMVTVIGIPITVKQQPIISFNPSLNPLRVVYIGRAVDWKVFPFIYCAKKLLTTYENTKFQWHVYTDDANKFLELATKIVFSSSLKLNIFENFTVDDIWLKELDKASLCIGMGTSQFESLLLNLPTLLIPAIADELELEKFDPVWAHTLPDFVFGCDASTLVIFENVYAARCIRLTDKKFNWSDEDFNRISAYSERARLLYSSELIFLKVIDICATNGEYDSYKTLSFAEVRLSNTWNNLVTKLKKLCQFNLHLIKNFRCWKT